MEAYGYGEANEVHEGEKYLGLLGLSHLADVEVSAGDRMIRARDFLDVCGEHARPMLVGFESLSPEDPRYEPTRAALSGVIMQFLGTNPEQSS